MANKIRRNRVEVPEARAALDQMKLEVAKELGIENYDKIDKGNLTARQNGYVGGYMTKRLVEMAEKAMANQGVGTVLNQSSQPDKDVTDGQLH